MNMKIIEKQPIYQDSNNNFNILLIVLLMLSVFLLLWFFKAWPFSSPGPTVNVPDKIDVNINKGVK